MIIKSTYFIISVTKWLQNILLALSWDFSSLTVNVKYAYKGHAKKLLVYPPDNLEDTTAGGV